MDMSGLIKQVEENIEYQVGKLSFLWGARDKTNDRLLEEAANQKVADPENSAINQALTDAIMNSMASLIDYYCMYCFMKIGVKSDRILRVQYRPMNNHALSNASLFKEVGLEKSSVKFIKSQFNSNITGLSGLDLASISIHDYWPAFFGDAISAALHDVRILSTKKFEYDYKDGEFKIDTSVRKYHCYMHRLYCNEHFYGGVKYSIYVDINNCLKHNIVPYVTPKLEMFGGEQRGFSYFEFKKDSSIFLKPGLLRDLVELDFDELRLSLEQVYSRKTTHRCSLEQEWEMDDIIKVDKGSGYISKDQNTLYFFIDNVLMAKSRDATFVDAGLSLKKTLSRLIDDIKWGMNLELSEFD